jgi:hypothetical protein
MSMPKSLSRLSVLTRLASDDTGNTLVEDGRQDEELSEWFRKIDTYARKVFLFLILFESWS